jgi:RNA polymerase sigma factor (sigma-70 family)
MTREEFQKEVLPLKNKLYRLAHRLLNHHEQAEDMVQETIIRLWTRKDRLEQYNSVEAFAMIIIKNMCLDFLRAAGHITTGFDDDTVIAAHATPHEITEMNDTMQLVHRLIAELPVQQKMIIHLRDVEGYDYEEIATILDMNMVAVRVGLSRARRRVRDALINTYSYERQTN